MAGIQSQVFGVGLQGLGAPGFRFPPNVLELRNPSATLGAQAVIALGVRVRGTLGDIDPLNKVPFKRATSRVQKGPL